MRPKPSKHHVEMPSLPEIALGIFAWTIGLVVAVAAGAVVVAGCWIVVSWASKHAGWM